MAFMQNMMYQVVKIFSNSPCLETVEIGRKLQFAAICALGLVFTFVVDLQPILRQYVAALHHSDFLHALLPSKRTVYFAVFWSVHAGAPLRFGLAQVAV